MPLPLPNQVFRSLPGKKGLLFAVSGGKDSTALMVLAARWKREYAPPCAMKVATVNHGLRPEAEAETHLVAANAKLLGLDCMILRTWLGNDGGAPDTAGNIQAHARQARYRCLADAAAECGFDTIVTAHHREDQAETFLLRLARGSGVYGLGAMREFSLSYGFGNGDIGLARPLLKCSRSDLHRLTEQSGLAWVDDPSNEDMAFARVRIRSIAPALAEVGLTTDRIGETADRMQRAGEALDYYASAHLNSTVKVDDFGSATTDVAAFFNAPAETVLRSMARVLQAVGGSDYTPRMDRLERLFSAMRDAAERSGAMRRTLNGCVADLKNGQLRLYREWGRSGLEQCQVEAGGRRVWDRRFLVTVPDNMPQKAVVAPLAAQSRLFRGIAKSVVLQTIPALYSGEELVAVPAFLNKENAAQHTVFGCRNLTAERLFNPRNSLLGPTDENSC